MSTSSTPPPVNRRLALAALGLGVFAPSVLAACAGTAAKQAESKKEPPAPQLKFQPADAASDVVPISPISVQVSDGWFQKVALTNSSGKVVAGSFNADRTVYTTTEPLGYDSTYTWSGSAVG
ncbi:Ig-like domain-containing protein, partial [Mycobacterium sp. E2327]|uniref:Ig-like domain-containing protein n=1 Tax=Mycobacterium sp. E2327 TaxID=1834132 RepID=UPI0027146389